VPSGGARFCGVQIPAGTVVGVSAAVVHRDTDIFGPDADQFRPERWIPGNEEDNERIRRMDRCNLAVSLLSFPPTICCSMIHHEIMAFASLSEMIFANGTYW
jgi:cytochrome P450